MLQVSGQRFSRLFDCLCKDTHGPGIGYIEEHNQSASTEAAKANFQTLSLTVRDCDALQSILTNQFSVPSITAPQDASLTPTRCPSTNNRSYRAVKGIIIIIIIINIIIIAADS